MSNYLKNYKLYFKPFISICKSAITKVNIENNIRQPKLGVAFGKFLYVLCQTAETNKTFDIALSEIEYEYNFSVSERTIFNKRKSISYKNISSLNDQIITFIYKGKTRTVAVDGSILYLPLRFKKYGFPLSQNKNCCIALLSTLFDPDLNIPIDYRIHKNKNERQGSFLLTTIILFEGR